MYTLSKPTLNDIKELLKIENECFTYDRLGYYHFYYQIQQRQIFIVSNLKEIMGYISIRFRKNYVYIASLAIKKRYRKKGIASFMLATLEKSYPIMKLDCKRHNINFYHKLGYKQVCIKYDYYTDGEDAITMEKDITCQKAGQD